MYRGIALIFAFSLAAALYAQDSGQAFVLEPGDYRWVPFTVRQTPAEVDCKFSVSAGDASVHLELMPISEFRLFERSRDHDATTRTPDSRGAEFRQVIMQPGRYAVVVMNRRNARAATVALHVETNMNPVDGIARTLSPTRRLMVILISFAVFVVSVTWSSRKLIRAMRS